MIYITGDTHIPIDITKFSMPNFVEQKQMTKNDYVIICGDFGGVWNNSHEEIYWRKWLNDKNFTTLFVDGNHENFNLLNQYPVEYWSGGKIHKISDSIYHLLRGQVFDIDSHTFFTMGGAESVDRMRRTEGISWWAEEMPNQTEFNEGMTNLDKHNWKVNYVISHTCSIKIFEEYNNYTIGLYKLPPTPVEEYFDILEEKLDFKHWYFGHYHDNGDIDNRHTILYNQIIPIRI
jgi:predicted phosphodiesterase